MKNERVQKLIEAFQAEQEKGLKRSSTVDGESERLQRELAEAKRALDVATDANLENPSDKNAEAERAARRKVADLTLDLSGVDHRRQRAHMVGSDKAQQLADEAIQAGREESTKYYRENVGGVLQAIEDAKYAYLTALTTYHKLHKDAGDIYATAVGETSRIDDPGRRPQYGELLPFYRQGDRQVHGVFPDEIERAFKQGIIYRQSVAEGREIN